MEPPENPGRFSLAAFVFDAGAANVKAKKASGTESAAAKSAPAVKDLSEMDKLMQMSNQLDDMDRQEEFDAAMAQANGCIKSWSFDCAEAQLARAAKSAKGAGDTSAMAASRQSLANERQRAAVEAQRRAEADRIARAEQAARDAEDERERRNQERIERAERRREMAERQEQERQAKLEHDRNFQNTLDMIQQAGNQISASIAQTAARNQAIIANAQAAQRRQQEEQEERWREQNRRDREARDNQQRIVLAQREEQQRQQQQRQEEQRRQQQEQERKACHMYTNQVTVTTRWHGKAGTCDNGGRGELEAFMTNHSGQKLQCRTQFRYPDGSVHDEGYGDLSATAANQGGEWGGVWSCGPVGTKVEWKCALPSDDSSCVHM